MYIEVGKRVITPHFHGGGQAVGGRGSLRDVQLAGHAALSTTQRYIEADVEAQRKL